MTRIDPYIRVLFIQAIAELDFPAGYQRRDQFSAALATQVKNLLTKFKVPDITNVRDFSEEFLQDLIKAGVLVREELEFAGEYFGLVINRYQSFRIKALEGSAIAKSAERIGGRYFGDVFAGYIASQESEDEKIPALGIAPAADRVVTFSDNQVTELDDQTTELIEAVSAQNQIEGAPGLRELLLGQLRAGRELIRAGTCRLYLLELTLLETLKFLAKRYEKEVIGGLAAALIAALVKHFGIDA